MKKLIIGLLFSMVFTSAFAQSWIRVAYNEENIYEIRQGSVEANATTSGVKVYVAVGRTITLASKKISASLWYVSVEDCKLQRGKFVVLGTSGEFQSEHDFVFGLGTISATIAEIICTVASSASPKNKPSPSV